MISEPKITADFAGDGKTAKFDEAENVVFGSDWLTTPSTPIKRASMEMNYSSQECSTSSFFQPISPQTGLSIRVNFSEEPPLVKTKVETFVNYIHHHLTTKLRDSELVNTIIFRILKLKTKNMISSVPDTNNAYIVSGETHFP